MKLQLERVRRLPTWPRWALGVVALWLAMVGSAVAIEKVTGQEFRLCLFKRTTGQPCPTCGSTRSVTSAMAGRPLAALLYNPYMAVVYLACLAHLAVRAIFGRRVRFNFTRPERYIVWAALIAGLLANWAWLVFFVEPGGVETLIGP